MVLCCICLVTFARAPPPCVTPSRQVKTNAFDDKMKEDAKKMENMMLGGTAVTIAAILAILLPLLSSQE